MAFKEGGLSYSRSRERSLALVAATDVAIAAQIRNLLETLDFDVESVSDVETAFRKLEASEFRVVISEWDLVGAGDGIALCESVRRRGSSMTYFALLGGESTPETRHEAFLNGVDAILEFPLEEDDFCQRIRTVRRTIDAESEMRSMANRLNAANQKMALASRRFEELFDGLPIACFTIGPDGLVYEWNREAEDAFGIPGQEAFMKPVTELFGSRSRGFWSEDVLDEARTARDLRKYQWSHFDSSGTERAFIAHLYPSVGADGATSGIICANADITDRVAAHKQIQSQMIQLEHMNRRLEELATTDGLTGLYNHRYFQDALATAIAEKGAGLVLLDVDRFKQFNDTFGHQAGDAVLRRVGAALAELATGDFVAARYGGEEFAVIMPGVGIEDALAFAEIVRKTIQSQPWVEREVTASIGVSWTAPGMDTPKELIRKADEGLYASKEGGRNRITLWTPDLSIRAA